MVNPTDVIVDDSDPKIQYSGNWVANTTDFVGPSSQRALYGSLHRTDSNSMLSFSFNGTSVSVMAQTLPASMPNWECFIDRIKILSISFTNGLDNLPIFSETLEDGAHTLTIVANATQEIPFWFDYIKYTPSASVDLSRADTVLDPEESATFGQGWTTQGSSGSMTVMTGSTLSLNFTGVSMTWLGNYNNSLSHSSTTATYSIDGQTPITFSVNNPTSTDTPIMFNQIVFQTSNYSAGTHHLEVVYGGNPQTAPLTVTSLIVQQISEPRLSPNITSSASISPSTNHTTNRPHNIGTIIGGVIGSISFLALIIGVLFLRRWTKRNRRNASTVSPDAVQPFNHNPLLASSYNDDSSIRPSKLSLLSVTTGNNRPTLIMPRPSKARTLAQAVATPINIPTESTGSGSQEIFIPPRLLPLSRAPPPEIMLHLDSGLRLPHPNRPDVIEVPPIYSPI